MQHHVQFIWKCCSEFVQMAYFFQFYHKNHALVFFSLLLIQTTFVIIKLQTKVCLIHTVGFFYQKENCIQNELIQFQKERWKFYQWKDLISAIQNIQEEMLLKRIYLDSGHRFSFMY